MKHATIKDVAEAARCSTTLVSRVMNAPRKEDGTPDCVVNPKTAERIFEAVKALGYRPNKAAVSLRKKLKKRIGVVLPDLSNQFFAGIAKHFEAIAHKNGYVVLFGSSNERADQLRDTAEAFIEDGVDGIVMIPGVNCGEAVRKIADSGTPVILTARDIPEIKNVGKMLLDSESATETILRHLTENGYRHIEMLSKDIRIPIVEERERLYVEYMQKHGLPHRIYHVSESDSDLAIILEQAHRNGTDALYCISARLPIRCLTVGKAMGIRFPQDIALTGYDGGFMYDALSPTITQIEYSREEIAEDAFDMLMEMIASQGEIPEHRYLKGRFMEGESTSGRKKDNAGTEAGTKERIKEAMTALHKALKDLD